jgi:flagellar hook-associated protein 3 FlgL
MRITFNSQFRDAQTSLDIVTQRMVEMQRQVASGKRVSKPSDDPSTAAASVSERAQIGSIDQYKRAADGVSSRLTVIDTALADMLERITAAQTAATSARGSIVSPAQREAAAMALEGIRAALLDGFNTSFRGTYIFSGASSDTPPYQLNANGVDVDPYGGNAQEVAVDIGEERSVTVMFNGETIVQRGAADDLFANINAPIVAARAGDNDALGNGIVALKGAFERVSAAQGRVGIGLNVVDVERNRLEQIRIAGIARLSQLEEANMAEAISEMSQAEMAYRAALGAVSTGGRMSLLDFLG